MRDDLADARLPWRLLGVHSARLDMVGGSNMIEESLGLNCAWYADILLTLTTGAADAPPTGVAQGDAPV